MVESAPSEGNRPAFRYERKFVCGFSPEEALLNIRLHPSLFHEIYDQRAVNNLYLDTVDLRSMHETLEGIADRVKVRIRWYGRLWGTPERPTLEFKRKQGFLGWKESYLLTPVRLDAICPRTAIAQALAASDLPALAREAVIGLEPSILNRYHRRYFLSADRRYRLTLDWDMQHSAMVALGGSARTMLEDEDVIVELKYDEAADALANTVANHFPFRVTRNSKYVRGLQSVFPGGYF